MRAHGLTGWAWSPSTFCVVCGQVTTCHVQRGPSVNPLYATFSWAAVPCPRPPKLPCGLSLLSHPTSHLFFFFSHQPQQVRPCGFPADFLCTAPRRSLWGAGRAKRVQLVGECKACLKSVVASQSRSCPQKTQVSPCTLNAATLLLPAPLGFKRHPPRLPKARTSPALMWGPVDTPGVG